MHHNYFSKVALWALLFLSPLGVMGQTDANIPLKGIVIYIDYPGSPPDITNAELDDMLNDISYSTPTVNRSVRSYWLQESRRNYVLDHDIFYYTAPEPASFYEALSWQDGLLLWRDALEDIIANNPGYDWGALSTWSPSDPFNDERPTYFDGALKAVSVISSVYGPAALGAAHYPQWTLSNGVQIGSIQGSAIVYPWSSGRNLFMFLHETGHSIFNLPDTYDYDGSSGGTAKYTVMSAQGPDVEPIGAPFLYQHQWGESIVPQPGSQTIALTADGDSHVVIRNIHDPKEYFTIEARKNSTLGNSLFPVPLGLLIWHTDLKVHTSNTLENTTRYAHYKHSVEQKDGLFELEFSGSNPPINSGDIYVEGDSFNDATFPDAKWWSGEDSGLEISNIEFIGGDIIQFTVTMQEEHPTHYSEIPKDDWTVVSATQHQVGHEPEKAFDDDLSTYYHIPFGSNQPRPHQMIIDLGDTYDLTEFYYTANDNYTPPWEGRIENYEFYLSEDGVNWGTPTVAETFFRTPYAQYALFDTETARYIKFDALNSYNNEDRTSIAEIGLRGTNETLANNDLTTDWGTAITVVPNPTKDMVHIGGMRPGDTMVLTSVIGVRHEAVLVASEMIALNLSGYAQGVYFLSIADARGRVYTTKKVIKF